MKHVLVLTDISGLGNCSLTAALPILTACGYHVMPAVTGSFSCQTGFSGFEFVRNCNIEGFVDAISSNSPVDAVYTGFFTDGEQLTAARKRVSYLTFETSCVYKLVDPIMGDNGSFYPVFDIGYADEMRLLVKSADCIVPNLTEACLLAEKDYASVVKYADGDGYLDYITKVFDGFTQKLDVKSAVITGIDYKDKVVNAVFDGGRTEFVSNPKCSIKYSGTGDVFASALLSCILGGSGLIDAVRQSADTVYAGILAADWTDRRMGINLSACVKKLLGGN
ncbi:MAG: bifunctional hydroxymethylpyrimidine kinase/phosphomethylpyrimidine kinase [Corallococcus sp.]|nr:bifunctional hydroxymethylpyrimidine kinase/phosphomethylpyrimidine kinase [Corallococcus sp.]